MLAAIGFIRLLIKQSPLLIFPAWAILHTLGYTLLRIAYPFAWYYAPLILTVILLGSIGGMTIIRYVLKWKETRYRGFARTTVVSLSLFFIAIFTLSIQASWSFVSTYETAYYAGARDRVYRQVGYWLATHSAPDATIALTEVGTVGYFSEQRVINLMGLVTYEFRNLPKQGDFRETVEVLQPDYIVATRGLPPDPELTGFDRYTVVREFPKGDDNLFEDVIIYQLNRQ